MASETRFSSLKSILNLSCDLGYLKTVNVMTLSLVCHGNSVLGNTTVDICVLEDFFFFLQRISFNDEFSLRAL